MSIKFFGFTFLFIFLISCASGTREKPQQDVAQDDNLIVEKNTSDTASADTLGLTFKTIPIGVPDSKSMKELKEKAKKN